MLTCAAVSGGRSAAFAASRWIQVREPDTGG
jgi:hypothetical protein